MTAGCAFVLAYLFGIDVIGSCLCSSVSVGFLIYKDREFSVVCKLVVFSFLYLVFFVKPMVIKS